MGTPAYVELHAKSAFSFLEATATPEDLAAHYAHLEQPALALTDAHGVYGAARFHFAAKKFGLRALIGAEVALSTGARLTLLVENQRGYQNLCRLLTRTKLREGRQRGKIENPCATEEELAEYARGLICLTGGSEGALAQHCRNSHDPDSTVRARQEVERFRDIYGAKNVYLELQRHFHREQEARNQVALAVARSLQLPLLATNAA